MPTKKEMLEQLQNGNVSIRPLSLLLLKKPDNSNNHGFDALVEVSWGKKKINFVVECKSLSTPKSIQNAVNRLKIVPIPKGFNAMLFVPYLNEKQLMELEKIGISGIDLCGNGIVVSNNRFVVFRSGGKNRFTSSAPIKNIYRKNSSMVGRVFLVRSKYETVKEVCAEINRRNPLLQHFGKKPMSISTVSKALKTLEEDLIISRDGQIRLLQPEKLLQKLSENYAPPEPKSQIRIRIPEDNGTLITLLQRESQKPDILLLSTGKSSVGRYAVMLRENLFSVYCPKPDSLLKRVRGNSSDRFPNFELFETEEEPVYFDCRYEEGFWWASPVQVYLELMAGDKRDRETAEQVRSFILKDLDPVHQ